MKIYSADEIVIPNTRKDWKFKFAELGEWDSKAVVLVGDVSRSTITDEFRKKYPNRFFNVGIAEQNMLGMAAGLALTGKHPYCIAFAPFLSMRACEQFRTDVCYMNLNVKMISVFGGVTDSGTTHSGIEDCGIIRTMANSTVVSPSDATMVEKVFKMASEYVGPMYIKLDSGVNTPVIYAEDYSLQLGKALKLTDGNDITICSFGSGNVIGYALKAAEELQNNGIGVRLLDMVSLKPIDRAAVIAAAKETKKIITVEDHNVIGGIGTAVSEIIAEEGISCKVRRLGVQDMYPCNGPVAMLHHKYGYAPEDIVKAAIDLISK